MSLILPRSERAPWEYAPILAGLGCAPDEYAPTEARESTGLKLKVPVRFQVAKYEGVPCIDVYRHVYGKALGEAHWFAEFAPVEVVEGSENLLMIGGASVLWEALIGNAPTYLNNANGYIGVGDSSTATTCTQTGLQASSNKAYQAFDATYPLHTDGTGGKTITGATNATPIVITATSHGFSTGDWVQVSEIVGNTAGNGVFQVTVTDANTFSLNGSVGNGAYTSGGVASKFSVLKIQATFGTGSANFAWNEWACGTGSTLTRTLNRKQTALGTKTSAASWAFLVALGLV